jgi:hypothetical protein
LQSNNLQLSPAGLEQSSQSSGKTASEPERAAFLRAISTAADQELAEIVSAWASLPETLKADILAMVRAASGAG